MYYYTYDPWVGKTLHLEDFYISEEYQGKTTISSIYKPLNVSKLHFNIKTIDMILRYSDNSFLFFELDQDPSIVKTQLQVRKYFNSIHQVSYAISNYYFLSVIMDIVKKYTLFCESSDGQPGDINLSFQYLEDIEEGRSLWIQVPSHPTIDGETISQEEERIQRQRSFIHQGF